MLDSRYLGLYAKAFCPDKSTIGILTGADTLVGDDFEIFFKKEEGDPVAWVKNRFGDEIGYFNRNISYRLATIKADGWTIRATLAFVGIEGGENSLQYFSMMGIIASSPRFNQEVDEFTKNVKAKLIEGTYPDIELSQKGINKLIDAGGKWMTEDTVPFQKKEKGMAMVKGKRTITEGLVEQARAGNKGCYVISYAFIGVLIVGAIFLVKTLLGI